MKWILIYALYSNGSIASAAPEFDDKAACESAGRQLDTNFAKSVRLAPLGWFCTPKKSESPPRKEKS